MKLAYRCPIKKVIEDHSMNLVAFQPECPLNWRAFAEISCYNMYTKARSTRRLDLQHDYGESGFSSSCRQVDIALGEL